VRGILRNEGDALGIVVLSPSQNRWWSHVASQMVPLGIAVVLTLFFTGVGRSFAVAAEPAPAASAREADAPVKIAPSMAPLVEQEKRTLIRSTRSVPGEPEAPATPRRIWDKMLIGLLMLGGILWGGLYLMKKLMPGGRQLFTTPAMEVLGRSHLDPQRYLALVRVGERVVVVGVSPDGIRPVTEFASPEEVAQILEIARPKSENGGNVFARLFQDSIRGVKKEESQAEAEKAATTMSASIESLRERVRGLGQREDNGQ